MGDTQNDLKEKVDEKQTHDIIKPSATISAGAKIKNMKQYQTLYDKSIGKNRDKFWDEVHISYLYLSCALYSVPCTADRRVSLCCTPPLTDRKENGGLVQTIRCCYYRVCVLLLTVTWSDTGLM